MEEIDWFELLKWLLGVSAVVLSLWYTIRHFKIVRTIAYIERFNSPLILETRSKVEKWSRLPEEEKRKELEENETLYYQVNLVYNIMTEIAVSYRYRIINRKLTCELFDPIIPRWYEKIEPFISFNNERGVPHGYDLEVIMKAISKHGRKRIK
ncbi:MAG: hypothetical protein ABJG78_10475 [Cyclobacteriaceae bacterium]